MADVLSQSEIDNLLEALSHGSLEEEEDLESKNTVKKFDFKTANKFTKDQLKTLNNIYSNFSHMLSTYLSGTLRTVCRVEVLSTEEQTYSEYTNSLQAPIVLAILDMVPLDGATLLEMSSNVAYGIINRLLGGAGGDIDPTKPFTDIDIALTNKVLLQIAKIINDAWAKVLPISTRLSRIETSPQFAQIVAYNEPVAIITIRIKIADEVEGFVNICIPFISLEQVVGKLDESMWVSSKKIIVNEENTENIKNRLLNSNVEVTAKFKETLISLGDLVSLEKGDVLRLDHKASDELVLSVVNIPKFRGKLGLHNNRYAIKIAGIIEEDDENDR